MKDWIDEFLEALQKDAEESDKAATEHYRRIQKELGITAADIEEHDKWMHDHGVHGY